MILTIYLLWNPPIEVLYPDFQFQFYISCLKFIIIESTGILCELHTALLRSQGTLLKYQVEKHEQTPYLQFIKKRWIRSTTSWWKTIPPFGGCIIATRQNVNMVQKVYVPPNGIKATTDNVSFASLFHGFSLFLSLFIVYCDFILVVVFICIY